MISIANNATIRNLTVCLPARLRLTSNETLEHGGGLPLLTPMSEVAGRMSVQAGAKYLEAPAGGSGILLGGVPWNRGCREERHARQIAFVPLRRRQTSRCKLGVDRRAVREAHFPSRRVDVGEPDMRAAPLLNQLDVLVAKHDNTHTTYIAQLDSNKYLQAADSNSAN